MSLGSGRSCPALCKARPGFAGDARCRSGARLPWGSDSASDPRAECSQRACGGSCGERLRHLRAAGERKRAQIGLDRGKAPGAAGDAALTGAVLAAALVPGGVSAPRAGLGSRCRGSEPRAGPGCRPGGAGLSAVRSGAVGAPRDAGAEVRGDAHR